jgi:hypothetical protein
MAVKPTANPGPAPPLIQYLFKFRGSKKKNIDGKLTGYDADVKKVLILEAEARRPCRGSKTSEFDPSSRSDFCL